MLAGSISLNFKEVGGLGYTLVASKSAYQFSLSVYFQFKSQVVSVNSYCTSAIFSTQSLTTVYPSHVARKATLRVQNGTNLKVDFFECLDPPRYHMGKKFGFHCCP